MSPLEPMCVGTASSGSVYVHTGPVWKIGTDGSLSKDFFCAVVRRHLQPQTFKIISSYPHPLPSFKTRFWIRTNVFQELRKVHLTYTQLECAQTKLKKFALQDSHHSRLNTRSPLSILYPVQLSSIFFLPKYFSIMGSRKARLNNPGIKKSVHALEGRTSEREDTELKSLLHPKPNNQETFTTSADQQDHGETPSKRRKVEDKDTNVHDDNPLQSLLTSSNETETTFKNTSTYWNNRYRQSEHDKEPDTCSVTVVDEVSGFKSYCGLLNQGATCYLNSLLQTFFMTEDFKKDVMKLTKAKKNSVSAELKKLFNALESKTGSVTTYGITNALEIRNVGEQQDAAEYFLKILSLIEPEPSKIFQGTMKHSTTCQNPHENKEEIISFFSLTVPMESDHYDLINVQNSLDTQFEDTFMKGEDQLYCENCDTCTDMKISCIIVEEPQVLTLHMQRFNLDYNFMTYVKNNSNVKIPLQLSLKTEGSVYDYDLYAIVNHVGSLHGGHYYAEIKSPSSQWYEFNDSMVQTIPNFYRIRCSKDHLISESACLLFYRKSNSQEIKDKNETEVIIANKSKSPRNNMTNCKESDSSSIVEFEKEADHVNISMPQDQPTERDCHQEPQGNSFDQPETNENPSIDVADTCNGMDLTMQVQSPESTPNIDVRSTTEPNKKSEMTFNVSDMSHQRPKTKGSTEISYQSTVNSETSGQHLQRVISGPKHPSDSSQNYVTNSLVVEIQEEADPSDISMTQDQLTNREPQDNSIDQPEATENPSQEISSPEGHAGDLWDNDSKGMQLNLKTNKTCPLMSIDGIIFISIIIFFVVVIAVGLMVWFFVG